MEGSRPGVILDTSFVRRDCRKPNRVKTAGLWTFSRHGDAPNKKHERDTTRPP